jgi:hypothetical protein
MTRRDALSLVLLIRKGAEKVRRFAAPEAGQAVAVDANSFYAIGNHAIARYDKRTGKRLAGWECERGKPLIHLNSGIVRGGTLHCAHSNYPGVPMVSSIETWEAATLRHTGGHSFGIFEGSATWIDFHKGHWYVTFAHYGARNAETSLVRFDSEWRRLEAWVYPPELIAKLGQYSISGGVFAPGDRLLATGHDNPEIYVLAFPRGGSVLMLEDTVPAPVYGQGIALDPASPDILYGIDRAKREVVVMRLG